MSTGDAAETGPPGRSVAGAGSLTDVSDTEFVLQWRRVRVRDFRAADLDAVVAIAGDERVIASWLHQDTGDFSRARYWLDRALEWSQAVGDAELTAYVMARKSQVAGEARDLDDVVDLAGTAQRLTRPGSRVAAIGKTYEALGHALRWEADASARAFDDAMLAVEKLTADPSPWGAWLSVPYVEIHRAQAIETLGQHASAAEIFTTAIQQLPADYHRDRGVYLAREAISHAGAEAPQQAANVGMQSLCIAEDTGSGRILRELARLDNLLRTWDGHTEVAEFHTALDSVVVRDNALVPRQEGQAE